MHSILDKMFWWNEQQNRLAQDVGEFVERFMDREQEIRWTREFPLDIFKEVGKRGWFGIVVPKEFGGSREELGCTGLCIVNEGLGRIFYSTRFYSLTVYGGPWQIVEFGNKEQKQKWLPRIARGDYLGAIVMTEPFTGSNAAGMQVTARKEGDHYVINGKKRLISSAGRADLHMVYCRTSDNLDDVKNYRHLSAFIVEKGMPGLTVEKINEVMGAVPYRNGTLDFNNVRVPIGNMLGEEGDGWRIMMNGINIERLMVAASCSGGTTEALRQASGYVNHRVVAGKKLSSNDIIRHKISNIVSWIEITRTYLFYVAKLMDQGIPVPLESTIAKVFASEKEMEGVLEAIQCMGGDGVMMYYPVEKFVSSAKISMIGGGTNEVLRSLIYRQAAKSFLELNQSIKGYSPKYDRPKAVEAKEESLESKILLVLASEYRKNPALHTEVKFLKELTATGNSDMLNALKVLESSGFIHILRSSEGEIDLVKATYAGLKEAASQEYYRMIPPWVNSTDIF